MLHVIRGKCVNNSECGSHQSFEDAVNASQRLHERRCAIDIGSPPFAASITSLSFAAGACGFANSFMRRNCPFVCPFCAFMRSNNIYPLGKRASFDVVYGISCTSTHDTVYVYTYVQRKGHVDAHDSPSETGTIM
jgi:hypothetical protein